MELFDKVRDAVDQARGTEIERKVKEATSNEKWGAPSTLKNEIARATFDYQGFREVMPLVWERMRNTPARNWRIVFKTLELLEHLLRVGSDRVIEETQERIHIVRTLVDISELSYCFL